MSQPPDTLKVLTVEPFSAAMSFGLVTVVKRIVEGFFGRFPENNVWYVLYPFFTIFRFSGFFPVQPSLEKYPEVEFSPDLRLCIFTSLCVIGITVGFGCGVYDLSHMESLGYRTSNLLSYITSWGQIFSLFLMGCVALVTSWANLKNMKNLIKKIREIDASLEAAGAKISYKKLRKNVFMQLAGSFVVPTCLSMVNCVMIKTSFSWTSCCYWFICFAPILLLAFKELQFFNLMIIVRDKFNFINTLIGEVYERYPPEGCSMDTTTEDGILLPRHDSKFVDQMAVLSQIYSELADCVDSLLEVFATHILTVTCAAFAVITIQSYNLFALLVNSLAMHINGVVFTVSWILVQIMVIGINVIACSQTSNAMADTGAHVHRLSPRETQSIQIVQVFSLQILHRKKSFSAAGFFDMNFKLFTSIVAAVTTYLIIIIQFHMANLQMNGQRNMTRI